MTTSEVSGFRVSAQQRRLWNLGEPRGAFGAWAVVRVAGPVDPTALRASMEDAIRDHEVLRTHVRRPPGVRLPLQVVETEGELDWRRSDPGDAGIERCLPDLLAEERSTVPTVEEGPLLRAHLVRLSADEALLSLVAPAFCVDGRSWSLLVAELGARYAAAVRGAPLGSEAVRFVQFSEWQNEVLAGEETDRELWADRLGGIVVPLGLGLAGGNGFRPELVELAPGQSASRLRELEADHGVSSATFWETCWRLLLARLSGVWNLTLGRAVDERTFEELESAVGPLSRWLPVSSELMPQYSFLEAARRVGAALEAAQEHLAAFDWPELSAPGEGPPVFTAGFEHLVVGAAGEGAGVRFTLEDADVCLERAAVSLVLVEGPVASQLRLRYDATRLAPADARHLLETLGVLAAGALARPDGRIEELPLLAEEERGRILGGLPSLGAPPAERTGCLHQRIEVQARRTPERRAAAFGDRGWTYAELDAAACRWAGELASAGVGVETRVGLALGPGLDLLAATLGVLKAGGTYVPLDPTYPAGRLGQIAREAGIAALVIDEDPAWELDPEVVVLRADRLRSDSAGREPVPPRVPVTPDNAAYVLFTSGSTGRPKGVQVSHRALLEYLEWSCRSYGVDEETEGLAHSPLGFDLTVTAFFSPLLAGGAVRLLPSGSSAEPLILDLERRNAGARPERTVLLKLTPSHLRALAAHPAAERLMEPVRCLVVGGEALRYEDLAGIAGQVPRVVNEYGPTEAVVGCAAFTVERGGEGGVPIGRPGPMARLYVVNPALGLLPRTFSGQLTIGGHALARGYLDRPAATAGSFVPDPYAEEPGARLYLSGDLARLRMDGELEFLGRLDDQVKIRGFRVEPGEVESCLAEHPELRRAAVVLGREAAGEPRLIAYVVPQGKRSPAVEALHEFLRARLPAPMLPEVFVPLDALPLTANGKVDRAALPAPPSGRPELAASAVPPRDPLEGAVTELWREILDLDEVGVHDDFFLLGGHSLLATQLVSRVRDGFGVEVDLNEFFAEPTVARLARRVEDGLRGGSSPVPPIERISRNRDLPLSFAQQRLWFVDRMDPGQTVYNIPVAIRLAGRLELPALNRTFEEVLRRHESLRTRFEESDGRPFQRIDEPRPVRLPVVDLRGIPAGRREETARNAALAIADRPFDLARAPLWRACVLRLDDEDHAGVVSFHHIVSDAWSVGVLVREVSVLYDAFLNGGPSPLEELPVQYADFAQWQRQWLQGEVLDSQLAYWRQHLRGAPPLLRLPTDHPRPSRPSWRGASEPFELSRDVSLRFGELVRREGGSLFMGLLAAFDILLARLGGVEDLVVGSPLANRSRLETEALIGFFVNVLPLRVRVSGELSFRGVLERAKEAVLGAVAHQDVPFERIVEALGTERRMGHSPVFQVVLSLHNAPMEPLDLPDLQIRPFGFRRDATKFDMVFNLRDTPGGIRGLLQYRTDLFAPATIRRILRQLAALLEQVCAAPDLPVGELDLLSDQEKAALQASTVVEELSQEFLF